MANQLGFRPNFITGLKSRMNQLASYFTEELEKELAKPNAAVEEYKRECQSLQFRVKNLEQKIEDQEQTIKTQNILISQIKDSLTKVGKRVTRKPAKRRTRAKPTNVTAAVTSPFKNVGAGQQTLDFAAGKSLFGTKRSSDQSAAPDVKYIKTEPGTSAPDESKPAASASGAAATNGFKMPGKSQPEAAKARRKCWTWGEKFDAIEAIQKRVNNKFHEAAAIACVRTLPEFRGVGEKILRSWWDDREKIRSFVEKNPQARNKKAFRKPATGATATVTAANASATADLSGFDAAGDSMIADIDLIELGSQ